jgi:hypothetical protein
MPRPQLPPWDSSSWALHSAVGPRASKEADWLAKPSVPSRVSESEAADDRDCLFEAVVVAAELSVHSPRCPDRRCECPRGVAAKPSCEVRSRYPRSFRRLEEAPGSTDSFHRVSSSEFVVSQPWELPPHPVMILSKHGSLISSAPAETRLACGGESASLELPPGRVPSP